MAKRRTDGKQVRVPAFGRYLAEQRRRSRRATPSVEAVARELGNMGITVDDATVRGYEYGWVDKPDPVVIWGLARLYRTDIHVLISILAANRQQPDLSDIELEHILRDAEATSRGETAAAARLAEVEERLHVIAAELLTLVSGDQPREPPATTGTAAPAGDSHT